MYQSIPSCTCSSYFAPCEAVQSSGSLENSLSFPCRESSSLCMSLLDSLAALCAQLSGHLQLWLMLALYFFDQLDYWCILCIFHFEILPIVRCFQVVRIPLTFFPNFYSLPFLFLHVLRHAERVLLIMSCQTTSLVFGHWSIPFAFLWVSEAACFWLSKYLLNFLILNVLGSCSLKPQIFFSFATISSNIL